MANYAGPIVDVDLHHNWRSDEELIAYMPTRWQEYARGDGGNWHAPLLPVTVGAPNTVMTFGRVDTWGEDGSPPGSDKAKLFAHLVDRYNYFRAVLTHPLGDYGTILNPYFAQVVCEAANNWTIDHWLKDDRFYSGVAIPTATPEEAVGEIRRVGEHPRMVAVLLCGNPFGRPIGDPIYHPIYAAAHDLGLAVHVHPSLSDRPSYMTTVAGGPLANIDGISQYSQQASHYLSSLVIHGVFEKFPNLKFVIKEYGLGWLPAVLWRLDTEYKMLQRESPWVRRLPSEYLREHIKIDTQPFEDSPDDRHGLATLLATVDGIDDMLCFASDYPHGSMDEPGYVARRLPPEWHFKVFCANACEAYGWNAPAPDWRQADAGSTPSATASIEGQNQ